MSDYWLAKAAHALSLPRRVTSLSERERTSRNVKFLHTQFALWNNTKMGIHPARIGCKA